MLAYRHAFHAGNHADVLKHLVLAEVLRYMGEKDKAYTVVDTHAGAGGYALDGRYAQKNAEHLGGIAALYARKDLPEPLQQYVQLVHDFNPGKKLEQYPGSPAIARFADALRGPPALPTSCIPPTTASSRATSRTAPTPRCCSRTASRR